MGGGGLLLPFRFRKARTLYVDRERDVARFMADRVRHDCLVVLLDFPQTSTRPRRSGSNCVHGLHDSKSVLVDRGCSLSCSRLCDCAFVAGPTWFMDCISGDRADPGWMSRTIFHPCVQAQASKSRAFVKQNRSTDMKNMVLCAVLAFALRTSGQATYQPPPLEVPLIPTAQSQLPNALPGVVIESWHYDPLQKTVTLHLVNRSHKDVTAFNISIAERYADGSTNPSYAEGRRHNLQDHQIMEDMLGALIQGNATFAAGTTRAYA